MVFSIWVFSDFVDFGFPGLYNPQQSIREFLLLFQFLGDMVLHQPDPAWVVRSYVRVQEVVRGAWAVDFG